MILAHKYVACYKRREFCLCDAFTFVTDDWQQCFATQFHLTSRDRNFVNYSYCRSNVVWVELTCPFFSTLLCMNATDVSSQLFLGLIYNWHVYNILICSFIVSLPPGCFTEDEVRTPNI